jgi:hypothetical protein
MVVEITGAELKRGIENGLSLLPRPGASRRFPASRFSSNCRGTDRQKVVRFESAARAD